MAHPCHCDDFTLALLRRFHIRTSMITKPFALAMLLILGTGFTPAAQAAERTRCFAETGYCVAGPILDYWEQHGGLPVFGYPISEQRIEAVEGSWHGRLQCFERDRLEDHGLDGVLAGRLGDRALQLRGIDWQQLPGDTAITPGCRFFRETQFNLCQPFLGYWERNAAWRALATRSRACARSVWTVVSTPCSISSIGGWNTTPRTPEHPSRCCLACLAAM
jgi:hypothetical protein